MVFVSPFCGPVPKGVAFVIFVFVPKVSLSLMSLGWREEDLWVIMFPCFSMDPCCCRAFPLRTKEPTFAQPPMLLGKRCQPLCSTCWVSVPFSLLLMGPLYVKRRARTCGHWSQRWMAQVFHGSHPPANRCLLTPCHTSSQKVVTMKLLFFSSSMPFSARIQTLHVLFLWLTLNPNCTWVLDWGLF